MTHEFHKKYRPKKFKDVVGQPDAISQLQRLLDRGLPHALLFNGPSGVGKTTLARILAAKLGCGKIDYKEINCADFRGIEMVREIRNQMNLAPALGDARVWVIDEAQMLTKDAQNAFLKMLEDTPGHVYFFLCTTDPNKLLKTILTRCTEVKLKSVHPDSLKALLMYVIREQENRDVSPEDTILNAIVEAADGSARKALVILSQVVGCEDEDEQLRIVYSADSRTQAIELARALIKPGAKWREISGLLKGLDDDPEGVRRLVLSYAAGVCMGGGALAPRAAGIIEYFRDHYYDCGKAGLVLSCWAVCQARA